MPLEEVYFVSQIASAVAIIASLVFVGLQLRQADKTQRALMHQARAQRTMDFTLGVIDPHNADLMCKLYDGDSDLSPSQLSQLMGFIRAYVINLEDIHWQCTAGLLDRAALENTSRGLRQFFSLPGVRAAWSMGNGGYAQDVVKLVDELILRDLPVATPGNRLARWKAELAKIERQAAAS